MATEGTTNPQRESYMDRAQLSQYERRLSTGDSSGESSGGERPESRRETSHIRRESTTLDPASYGTSSCPLCLFCLLSSGDRTRTI